MQGEQIVCSIISSLPLGPLCCPWLDQLTSSTSGSPDQSDAVPSTIHRQILFIWKYFTNWFPDGRFRGEGRGLFGSYEPPHPDLWKLMFIKCNYCGLTCILCIGPPQVYSVDHVFSYLSLAKCMLFSCSYMICNCQSLSKASVEASLCGQSCIPKHKPVCAC